MMKNKYIYIVWATILMLNFACSGFLDENPKNQIAVSQYFKSAEDGISIVNSIYRVGVPTYYNGSFAGSNMMMGGYMSGYFDNERRGERPGPQEAIDLSLNPDNLSDYLSLWWSECYEAISRANTAIKYLPEIPDLSTSEANNLMGEARFFRALNYFYLVKNFGDVPLIVEPYESLENLFVERTSATLVYDQIVQDLEWGVNNTNLPYVPFHENGYRITKAAIATLLSDVYLQMSGHPLNLQENYAKSAEAARLVISSGSFDLINHGSLPNESAYNKLRSSDQENEYIYSIEYDANLAPNTNPQFSYPANSRPPVVKYGNTYVAYKPSNDYLGFYEPQDLRIQNQQFFYNQITVNNQQYNFNFSAPYIWHDDQALFESGRGDVDVKVYRYAELLLIAAESIVKSTGVNSEAVNYLAEVRSRAFPDMDIEVIKAELINKSSDEFIYEVYLERLRELPFEFKIWSDIQRTRLYPKLDGTGEVEFVNVIGQENGFGKNFDEKYLLFPIPTKEIQSNPSLSQNPGY